MPAFTFEKISRPVRPDAAPTIRKSGGVIARMLGYFTESRMRRMARKAEAAGGFTEADITPRRTRRP